MGSLHIGLGIGIGKGGGKKAPPAPVYLPAVGSAPILALGTARLVSGYAGQAARVQRISDDVEMNLPFGSRYMDVSPIAGAPAGFKTWYDQSGGGWDYTKATKAQQPGCYPEAVYGLVPTISLDSQIPSPASTKRLSNAAGPTVNLNNCTIFVVSVPALSFNSNVFASFPDASNHFALYTRNTNVGLIGNWYNGSSVQVINTTPTPRMVPPIQTCIKAYKLGANKSFRLNGVKFDISGAASAFAAVGGNIGSNAALGVAFDGRFDVMAVVIYPTALSDADCALVEAALAANFPIITNQTAKVLFDGDSRVEGYGATKNRPWSKKILPMLNTPAYAISMGVAGQTLQTMSQNVAGRIVAQYDATRTRNVVVMGAPAINDFSTNRTAAQAQADFITYCTGINLANQKLITATVPLHTGHTGAQNTERVNYNAWLLANWATYSSDFVDLAAVPGLDAYNTTDWFDGVHFKDAGHDKWAAAFAPAINRQLA